MKKYEIMFIVKSDLEEAKIKDVASSMKKNLESNGAKVVDEKDMGQRELAYEIKNYNNGHYFLFVIETENNTAISEFDRLALINEDIIRHLIVKVDSFEDKENLISQAKTYGDDMGAKDVGYRAANSKIGMIKEENSEEQDTSEAKE